METTITLPFPPQVVWGTLGLLGIALASALVFFAMPKDSEAQEYIVTLRDRLGLSAFPVVAFLMLAIVWSGIAFVLTTGLINLILDVLSGMSPDRNNPEAVWEFRFKLVQITALTTVLGAVIALPITMSRLRLQRSADDTARESLFNEKINAATEGLYARRQVSVWKRHKSHVHQWQDDIVQRCAAIDRLEGLARENTAETPRIARLLSVYLRELSAEVPAQEPPKDATPDQLKAWAKSLPKPRSDMEKAAQTLGRLHEHAQTPLEDGEIDLRGANLQKCDLTGLKFNNALFDDSQLQGADLGWALLQGANLGGARLQGAVLGWTQLQWADLRDAQLQGADLGSAQLQGADLGDAQLQGANLGGAQ